MSLTKTEGRVDSTIADGWNDLIGSLSTGKAPASNAPTWTAFKTNLGAYSFGINDYIDIMFHIEHDYKQGTALFPHVHWTTDTTETHDVKWEITYSIAKGHQQGADSVFPDTSSFSLSQAGSGTAYEHMIVEHATGITDSQVEVDSLVIMRVKRITNGATDLSGNVFGLTADIHYEVDRMATENRLPNFYN